MREIKFRVWDRKAKQFDTCRNGGDNLGFGLDYKGIHSLSNEPFKVYQQFTGLKDKNGKEIYEGDIVKQMDIDWDKTSSDTEPVNYVMKETMRDVVTMDRFPCYWLKNEHFGYEGEDLIANEDCEIIGNIYENPELLKGGEKCST